MDARAWQARAARWAAPAALAYVLAVGWLLARYSGYIDFPAYYFAARAALVGVPFQVTPQVVELARATTYGGAVARFV